MVACAPACASAAAAPHPAAASAAADKERAAVAMGSLWDVPHAASRADRRAVGLCVLLALRSCGGATRRALSGERNADASN